MTRTVQTVDLSDTAASYYAPATITRTGSLVHVSGLAGTTTGGTAPSDYESQIHLALFNLRKVIIASGATISNIASLTLLIVGYDATKRQHARHLQRFLGKHRPAMTLIPVQELAVPGWLFEINAVMALPDVAAIPSRLASIQEQSRADVIIIGAGLSGLSAAHKVRRAGLTCIVLEARDRVGGKTWSQPLDDRGVVDLGAAWINDTNQSRMYELSKRYGADLIEQNTTGNCVLQDFDGHCTPFPYGELPKFDEPTREHLAQIRDIAEADCQALDVLRPKDTRLDSLTFEAYLRSRGADDTAMITATIWTRAMLGQDPRDISALFFLNYCKSGGGLLQMRSDRKDGGQYLRVRQGTQIFSKGLASSLPDDIVRLSSPVQAILQGEDHCVKIEAGGRVYAANKVITTVPGPVLKTISFIPRLPHTKLAWIDSQTYGYYTKAMIQFRSPFWTKKGFCGLAQSFVGPASVVRDTSNPEDSKFVLTCFMASDPGRAWAGLSECDRENTLLDQISQLFSVQDVRQEFIRMVSYEWVNDEFSGWGCPCTSLTPGVLNALGGEALRKSFGDVHFAGTETAGEWKGYMEGAVRSGERAAEEVIKSLETGVLSRL